MEGFQKLIPKISKDIKNGSDTLLLSAAKGGGGGVSAALSSTDQSHVLVTRPPPRQVVSLLTCSKLCAISFVVGVVFCFTLKRRVKRCASNILKRLKDN
ncbi:uncharacterized protein LOC126707107 isoform X2 [Quercus robur]|uniref:uncharacterized protein LOC126707107 isoform X2 n=1 Tax=Quercus robur TaxID=38942 RepID=UPI0021621E41|nr:uncharacterized protein LOC126707107 isoform X2 [Quercus robur]